MEALILNSMVEKVIFRNILRINRTLDNHLPTHGSSVYDLNQIHEILLGLEAADKLGVIRGAEREKITRATVLKRHTTGVYICTFKVHKELKYTNLSIFNQSLILTSIIVFGALTHNPLSCAGR